MPDLAPAITLGLGIQTSASCTSKYSCTIIIRQSTLGIISPTRTSTSLQLRIHERSLLYWISRDCTRVADHNRQKGQAENQVVVSARAYIAHLMFFGKPALFAIDTSQERSTSCCSHDSPLPLFCRAVFPSPFAHAFLDTLQSSNRFFQ